MTDYRDENSEIERLETKKNERTVPIDEQDALDKKHIMSDIQRLDDALTMFNDTGNKEQLFQLLFELMKTSRLHFQNVLETTGSRPENLNISLNRHFTIISKWYTTSDSSPEYNDTKEMKPELVRLSASSQKVIIPSILSLEFFLFVCQRIVGLIGGLKPELDENSKHKILLIVSILGSTARHTDNTGILNTGAELNDIERLTPENLTRVREIKNEIVKIHKENIRNSTGQLQITLSVSSAIGYLCEEIIKKHIQSAATGHTQPDSLSPSPSRAQSLLVRKLYTQQFLNDSPVVHQLTRQGGWCPHIFKKDGCYDRSIVHTGQYKHPDNYIYSKRCFYDIQTKEVVMIDPRAWPDLYKFTPRPNRGNASQMTNRVQPYGGGGGMRSRIMSRKLKKQSQISRTTIIHHGKHHTRSRRSSSTKRRTHTHTRHRRR